MWSGTTAEGFDLHPVYLAGRALAAHHPLYDVPNFVYLPSAALLVGAPLSAFGFGAASRVALIVAAGLVVGTVPLSARIMGRPAGGMATAIGVALVSLSAIVPEAIRLENLSILVGFVGAGVFLAWSRQRDVLCGALLGLSLAIKPLLALLFVALVVLRRWRAVAAALAVAAGLNLAAFAVDPSAADGIRSVGSSLLGDSGVFSGYFYLFNSALVGVGHLLGWSSWLTFGLRGFIATSAVAGAVAVWRLRPEPARSLEAGGLLLAGFYLSSTVLESHWLLVLVPFAFAGLEPGSPLRWWPVAVGGVFAAELVVLPQRLTAFGYYGTLTIQLSIGLCLVVVATATASLVPVVLRHRAGERGVRRRVRQSSA
jgi:arabinofuranan 3-O-arabinosyltransferase